MCRANFTVIQSWLQHDLAAMLCAFISTETTASYFDFFSANEIEQGSLTPIHQEGDDELTSMFCSWGTSLTEELVK